MGNTEHDSSKNKTGRRMYRISLHPIQQKEAIEMLDACSKTMLPELIGDALKALRQVSHQSVLNASGGREERSFAKNTERLKDNTTQPSISACFK